MGTKRKPGRYDCYGKANRDEPLFVLLARDASAPALVTAWGAMRQVMIQYGVKPASDGAKVVEAMQCAAAMRAWRKKHREAPSASRNGSRVCGAPLRKRSALRRARDDSRGVERARP